MKAKVLTGTSDTLSGRKYKEATCPERPARAVQQQREQQQREQQQRE
jgi:hypothetical protein